MIFTNIRLEKITKGVSIQKEVLGEVIQQQYFQENANFEISNPKSMNKNWWNSEFLPSKSIVRPNGAQLVISQPGICRSLHSAEAELHS